MKTVIATSDGSIQSDATARARRVEFKKGEDVTLPDAQADFLVKCKKAKEKPVKKVKTIKSSTVKTEDK